MSVAARRDRLWIFRPDWHLYAVGWMSVHDTTGTTTIIYSFILLLITLRSIISGSTRLGLISHRRHLTDSLPVI